ncbi:hypothetical protein [Spiroplasma endosymbiont of Panorpa germanica]|uniref:hypothetical protein n=1 Tax=Spiroplasma endosymbiont of Panorpa germanica TaxID=3066314 RepID=UPI0030CBDBEE
MKNYVIVISMWLILVILILTLNFINIKVIFKALVLEVPSQNDEKLLNFTTSESLNENAKSVFYFNPKGQKIIFKQFVEIADNNIKVKNENNYELPTKNLGYIYLRDETLLNYILKTIF